ncbi:hypothetical protein PRNP1_012089 [Phytophthora ramorum]
MLSEFSSDRYTAAASKKFLDSFSISQGTEFIWIGIGVLAFYYFLFTTLNGLALHFIRYEKYKGVSVKTMTESPTADEVYVEVGTPSAPNGAVVKSGGLPFTPSNLCIKDLEYFVTLPSGEEKQLLCGITAHFEPGRMVALMGATGAGKTTLMDVIAGRKTGGRIVGDIIRGGFTAYFGDLGVDSVKMLEYFESIPGTMEIRPQYNPATYMLEVIGAGIGRDVKDYSIEYKNSELYKSNRERTLQLAQVSDEFVLHSTLNYNPIATGFWNQLCELTKKQQFTYWRNPQYNFMRMFLFPLFAIIFGTTFYQLSTASVKKINSHIGLIYNSMDFIGVINLMTVLEVTCAERAVFYRERMSNYYGPLPYSLSLWFAEVPYLIVVIVLFVTIEYWLVGWSDNAGDFFFFMFVFYLYTSACTYAGQWMSALMPNEKVANVAVGALSCLFNLFSGYLLPPLVGVQFGYNQDVIAVTANNVTKQMTVSDYIANTYDFRPDNRYNYMGGLLVIWIVLQVAIYLTFKYYPLGKSFTVTVDPDATFVEVVNSVGDQVWKSASDRAFVSASTGLTTITQSSGNFELSSENVAAPAQNVTIGQVSSGSDSVEIAGTFGDVNWSWLLSFSLDTDDSQTLRFNARVDGADVANVYLAYESPRDEAFFGLGEQTGIGNLRGWRVPVWTREGGAGRGEEPITSVLNANPSVAGTFAGGSLLTTYTAVASLTSSLGRWIVLDGTNYALFNLASNETSAFEDTAAGYLAGDIVEGDHSNSSSTTVEIQYEGSTISGWLGRVTEGNLLLGATGELTKVTGRQPELPDWANDGAILGIQGGQDFVEGVIQDALNASLPLAGVWLQDWSGTRLQAGAYGIDVHRLWWNWEPDTTLYPSWAEWVPHLRTDYNVRTLSYINTFLANVTTKSTGYNTSFYDIAKSEGRFVTNTSAGNDSVWTITSGVGIDAGILDLSTQSTIDWFKDLVKQQYYSVPISGMMQDFGEYLAVDDSVSLSHDTISPREFHNAYPTVWATLLREVVEELGLASETIGFHRSAGTFSATHTNLFWVGDQNIDETREDGLHAAVSSALHVGASGFAHTHSDVGGYTNILSSIGNFTRSAALLGRWGELSAFSDAVFRTHEGNIPQVNAQAYTNTTTLAYHAYNTRLFRSLKKYRLALQAEYQEFGWPVLRHPIVYSPNDTIARTVIDESFWVGEALYVAPVYEVRATSLEVYLPPIELDSNGTRINGTSITYKHLWSGKEFETGQTVTVDSPWGQPGVFVRWPATAEEEAQLQELWNFVESEKTTVLTA